MSEETRSADRYAAWGIVLAVGCSAVVGFLYVLSMMFSIQVMLCQSILPCCLQQCPIKAAALMPAHANPAHTEPG